MKRPLLLFFSVMMCTLSLFLAVLPAVSVNAQAPAPSPTAYITTLTGVNRALVLRVRESPSLRGARLFTLQRGQIITILGISTNHRWFKIKTKDGKVGWVYRFFIRLAGGHISNLATLQ
ncbi:MAG TPA: SH3 domain-containing protein [Aggregatilineales bacterium]|nr:SH3 domain-containing protein [Aggregatilineales bacterium]